MRLAMLVPTAAVGLLAACGGPADQPSDAGVLPADATHLASDAGPADPNKPGPDFLVPTSPSYVTVEFKGLINSSDATSAQSSIIPGIGTMRVKVGDQAFELTTSDSPYAQDYAYPADDPDETLRGKHQLVVTGYHASEDSTATKGSVELVTLGILSAAAQGLGSAEHLLSKVGVGVNREDYLTRKDGSTLIKLCYQGLSDTGSKAFLDHSGNKTFAAGENLVLWANAVLTTDPATLFARLGADVTSYQGAPCECYLDAASFDCVTWDQEVADDGSNLSCAPPADFLTPPTAADHAVFKFKGKIEDVNNPAPASGYAPGEVSAGGQSFSFASGYASAFNYLGSDWVQLTFVDAGSGDASKFGRYELDVMIQAQLLAQAKTTGTNPLVLDASAMASVSAIVSKIEAYASGSGYLIRSCPFAVFRPGTTEGKLYDCPDKNTSFTVGEPLEIEGNLLLAKDVTEADVGTPLGPDGCYCQDQNGALVDCSTLPKP